MNSTQLPFWTYLIYPGVSAAIGIIAYIVRDIFMRLSELEEHSIDEMTVRQIIQDKTAPIDVRINEMKDDVKDIQSKLDRILDLIVHERYPNAQTRKTS